MNTPHIERIRRAIGDRYRIEREVGAGGMALVFLAHDLRHDRDVAVKVLRPELAAALGPERFLREIQIVARLNHPNILPLHESGEAEGVLYYVMPYIDGESLEQRLIRGGRLEPAEAMPLLHEVVDALSHAHAHGIVHRDIKPGNVMLSGRHALVTDFGIAKAVLDAGNEALTTVGIAIGTPTYMSPEQAAGDTNLDHRSDVYAIGVMAYEMLSGRPPFKGSTPQAVLAAQISERPRDIRTTDPNIASGVAQFVMRCLEKDPADRWRSADDMLRALDTLNPTGAGASSVEAQPAPTPARRPAKRRVLLGVLGLAVVLGAVLFAVRPVPPVPPAPRVVVLPFENLGSAEDAYYAAGITDEITSRLAQVSGMRVISRASAIRYAASDMTLRQIGDELGVDYVLSGTIRTDRTGPAPGSPGVVRVIPQLTSISENTVRWTTALESQLIPGQIIATQSRIAEDVARSLGVTLLPGERRAVNEGRTEDALAYDYFLRGTVFSARPFVEETTGRAITMYENAVALDSTFALAFARLAEAQSQYYFFFDRSETRRELAREAAERAVTIDPTNAAARLAMGYYRHWVELDYDRALQEFEAVRISQPNNSQLLYLMGTALRRAGRWDEALASYTRAFELNPRDQRYALDLGSTYLVLRRYDDSDRYLEQAAMLAPDWAPPHAIRATLYLSSQGDIERVRSTLRDAATRVGWDAFMVTMVRFRYLLAAAGGDVQDSLARLSLDRFALDSAEYYLANAEWHASRRRPEQAVAYYDSARVVSEDRVRLNPGDPTFNADLGIAHAGLGNATEAVRYGTRATELVPITSDAYFGPLYVNWLIQILIMIGDAPAAIDAIRASLDYPWALSPAQLRTDPHFASLRDVPAFAELVGGTTSP